MFMVAGGKYPKSSRKGKSLINFERGWKAKRMESVTLGFFIWYIVLPSGYLYNKGTASIAVTCGLQNVSVVGSWLNKIHIVSCSIRRNAVVFLLERCMMSGERVSYYLYI